MKKIFENTTCYYSGLCDAQQWLTDNGLRLLRLPDPAHHYAVLGAGTDWYTPVVGTIVSDGGFETGSAIVEIRDEFMPSKKS